MDRVLLHLNTSAHNFTVWLMSHYLQGDFPYVRDSWRLAEIVKSGAPPALRISVWAVPRPGPDAAPAAHSTESGPLVVYRFDVRDLGTLRDARVEVFAHCFSSALSLRLHFYTVLASIATAWPEALPALDRARVAFQQGKGGLAAVIRPASQPSDPPWLKIPDVGWDRQAVELLHEGCTSAEIARRTGRDITAKTVDNRLSRLRAVYGPDVVPFRLTPRKLGRKSGDSGY